MRIAVEATCWHNNRGYGRHARALLTALIADDRSNEYTLFFDTPESGVPADAAVRVLKAGVPAALAASASGHRSIPDMLRMGRALSSREFDLVLFPTIYSYVPVLTRARKVVIIHDVIAETYPKLTVPNATARWLWRTKVALGRMQADALVTVSEYSRRGIVERFGTAPDRVFVVGEASDPVFRTLPAPEITPALRAAGIEAGRRMVIYVGGFGPHKNLEALVRAFAQLVKRPGYDDLRLIMVGEYKKEVFHSYFGTIAAEVKRLGIEDRSVFTGYLADEDLVHLLNLGTVLVLPSLMEGFGLPAIEAAACGCPVIATKESPLPELLGTGGIFIDPHADELGAALELVASSESLRRTMRNAGTAAAGRLTWDAAATQMRSVLASLA